MLARIENIGGVSGTPGFQATGGKDVANEAFRRSARGRSWGAFFGVVVALSLMATDAAAQSLPPNIVERPNGRLLPAAGYVWLNDEVGDFRVRWQPGRPHPTSANVVASDQPNEFRPATGFRWANNVPGDFSVVANGITPYTVSRRAGPTDDAMARAILKIVGAAVADAGSVPQEGDGLLESVLRRTLLAGRDSLIESAVADVYPEFSPPELRAVRRAICLSMDGKLNQAEWRRSTARDEMLAALRQTNPDAANAAQVAEFVGQVVAARQR